MGMMVGGRNATGDTDARSRAMSISTGMAALLSGVALIAFIRHRPAHRKQPRSRRLNNSRQPRPGSRRPQASRTQRARRFSTRSPWSAAPARPRSKRWPRSAMSTRSSSTRRMATTPLDMFFGVPGIALQSDAKRAGSSVNIRGLQDFGRVAVIVDGARQDFQRSGHGTQSDVLDRPGTGEGGRRACAGRSPTPTAPARSAASSCSRPRTPTDFLRPGETWAASTSGRYETNGKGWTTSATGAYRFNDAVDVLGNIVWRDYGNYKDGDGDEVGGTGFDVLSGMLKATIRPTDNSELKLGWVGTYDELDRGHATTYDVDLDQNTFTGRYHITDEEQSWLDLHINASLQQGRARPDLPAPM